MSRKITDLDIEQVGNVSYTPETRTVFFDGLVKTTAAIMKMYSLVKDEHPLPREKIAELERFLRREARNGWIPAESRLGFTILSDGMINVSQWTKHPSIVVKNQIYRFDDAYPIINALPVDIAKEGTYCIWEEKILDFERDAWLKFLKSGKTLADKKRYLARYFRGELK